jgi:hypothetical protein
VTGLLGSPRRSSLHLNLRAAALAKSAAGPKEIDHPI